LLLLLPLQTVRDKCYKACVTKPSSSLSSSEQQCLARCCDRYADATQIVTKATLEMNGLQ
jgi:import inner membrane translocase subunit TIM13